MISFFVHYRDRLIDGQSFLEEELTTGIESIALILKIWPERKKKIVCI
jgi:hypothetical protein